MKSRAASKPTPGAGAETREPFDVDHVVPRPGPRDDRASRLPAGDGRGARPRSARCARPGRLRTARVDGRGPMGPPTTVGRRSCMSESQAIDRPRNWWKELIKMRRVRQFDAALVGGPTHRDYLVELGMPAEPHRPGIQRGRQRLFRHQGPAAGAIARPVDRACPPLPIS